MKEKYLGEFEQILLLAIIKLHKDAYGVAIRDLIINTIEREITVGALYTTLERLEKKGLLESSQGESSKQRGGRAKKYYTVTNAGKQALNKTKTALDSMWQGVQLLQQGKYADA